MIRKRGIALLLILALTLTTVLSGCGEIDMTKDISRQFKTTVDEVMKEIPEPQANEPGSDWIIFAMLQTDMIRSKDYISAYYDSLRAQVKSTKGDVGDYPTDKIKLAMLAMAHNQTPRDVEGYNLIAEADNYDEIIEQGLNGPMFALIGSQYCKRRLKNEDKYVKYLLNHQDPAGGFSYEDRAVLDMTAMGITALSFYQGREGVYEAIEKGKKRIEAELENPTEEISCEAISQIIIAYSQLKIDVRKTDLLERLAEFRVGNVFAHKPGGEFNPMATEQACLALASVVKYTKGEKIYEK